MEFLTMKPANSSKQVDKNLIPITEIWYQVQKEKEQKYCYKPYRTLKNY